MARRYLYYVAASLDGFIAGPDDALDWLASVERPGEDYGYARFYEGVDAVVMGRRTAEVSQGFGDWPYPGKPCVVLASRRPEGLPDAVECVADLSGLEERLDAVGAQNVWVVGGGRLAAALADAGRLDTLIVSLIPVALGSGVPLLPLAGAPLALELEKTETFASGLVQLAYKVGRTG
ncbi:dihydrofolate reductase family protein [Crenobacter cavernae]|uniref:Dihydrofolate reductase n=1 Tax=Crenobacter cavernae TaxID=2290923 RepID=A0A345Y3Z6_9NEIS|nr:dihydrofolate reductase family protein [Crenobacter cavernae]AXK38648.1 dihydrofolate reductase [Crenobacter cavernae]